MHDTGITKSDLINYRNHPADHIDELLQYDIPIFLIAGDSDDTVPYHENGKYLAEKYQAAHGKLYTVIKRGCNHHPHRLEDQTPLINFTYKYY